MPVFRTVELERNTKMKREKCTAGVPLSQIPSLIGSEEAASRLYLHPEPEPTSPNPNTQSGLPLETENSTKFTISRVERVEGLGLLKRGSPNTETP